MRPQKKRISNGAVTGFTATGTSTEPPLQEGLAAKRKARGAMKAQAQQGRTSWRGRAQLRMTLFTSRDGWDSSVGWL